jgi:hypothetical protein
MQKELNWGVVRMQTQHNIQFQTISRKERFP